MVAPDPASDPPTDPVEQDPKSFGNISEHHWSRARREHNQEALEYYRQRSHAPGVESGGGTRNFYCMRCDGVIPHDHSGKTCPHCGEPLSGVARRYFNWVELDQPAKSDFRALLPLAAGGAALLVVLAVLLVWLLS
jgi:hypothetical protein